MPAVEDVSTFQPRAWSPVVSTAHWASGVAQRGPPPPPTDAANWLPVCREPLVAWELKVAVSTFGRCRVCSGRGASVSPGRGVRSGPAVNRSCTLRWPTLSPGSWNHARRPPSTASVNAVSWPIPERSCSNLRRFSSWARRRFSLEPDPPRSRDGRKPSRRRYVSARPNMPPVPSMPTGTAESPMLSTFSRCPGSRRVSAWVGTLPSLTSRGGSRSWMPSSHGPKEWVISPPSAGMNVTSYVMSAGTTRWPLVV